MNIREVYQILRDRFQGKSFRNAVYSVLLMDNSVVLTSTIYGNDSSFSNLFKNNSEILGEISNIFKNIEETYKSQGFTTSIAIPTDSMIVDLENLFGDNGYTMYFKSSILTTQLTIYGEK